MPDAESSGKSGCGEMRIVINISGWDPARRKEIVNSIKGFVKSLAKRYGFQAEFKLLGQKEGDGIWKRNQRRQQSSGRNS